MTLVIWWLAVGGAVALMVGVALKLDGRRTFRPPLLLVEPLGVLITGWSVARFHGQTDAVVRSLALWRQAAAGDERLLDSILASSRSGRVAGGVSGLTCRPLTLIGEQRLLLRGRQRFSIVIGLRSEAAPFLILSAQEKKEVAQLEQAAGQHGFLVLLVGQTAVHSAAAIATPTALNHTYLGAIIVEANLDTTRIKQLGQLNSSIKLLTVLPPSLATYVAEQLGLAGQTIRLDADRPTAGLEAEALSATVFAQADHEQRYRLVRALEPHYHCQLASTYPTDQNLPIKRVQFD